MRVCCMKRFLKTSPPNTIPGSKNPEHLRSNFDIFDFALTDEEMQEIAKLDGTKRYYHADNAMEERYASMHLCIEK